MLALGGAETDELLERLNALDALIGGQIVKDPHGSLDLTPIRPGQRIEHLPLFLGGKLEELSEVV